MVENITSSIDNGQFTAGVFIDLKKAFDTIDHTILIAKLKHYGVRGVTLSWIESYLSNRNQYIYYNNVESDKLPITCGVPQGSILGPLLFLLYINDLCNTSKVFKFILFADDTNIFCTGKDRKEVENLLNSELYNLNKWFEVNKLTLNLTKTKYMIFGNHNENCSVSINNDAIEKVDSIKFLGIILDSKLSWNDHIQLVTKKVSRSMGILYRVKNILNQKSLFTLYCSLVLPYLNYACEIWGNTYASRIQPLIILQKKIIRIVCNRKFRDHTSELFYSLNCLKLPELISLKSLCVMYKAKNNLLPTKIQKYFVVLNTVHSHNTRSSSRDNFYCHAVRTKLKLFCLSVTGVNLWNKLDENIKQSKSLHIFKHQLKKLYKNSYATPD